MKLVVNRIFRSSKYTIGKLYIDGKYFCDTLEDTDRFLTSDMDLNDIKRVKVHSETAIPTGVYKVTLDIKSPKFSKYSFYNEVCNGKLPRLLNVPGFDGILIHVGDGYKGPELTQGCILVGYNKIKGGLLGGKEVFKNLYQTLKESDNITIEIK